MSTPESSNPTPPPVEDLIGSPELARAIDQEQFKGFLDHLPIAIAIARTRSSGQRIVYANAAFQILLGLNESEVRGKTWAVLDSFKHEDDPSVTLTEAMARSEEFLGTFRLQRDAKPVLVQAYLNIIENEDGSENFRLVALVDVSERERSQREAFERQIRGKDLLLQEIQHRVKNNLQLIVALIRLEARNARRGEAVDLARLAGRIDALKLLYDALSSATAGSDVDLGHYLGQIASAVIAAHSREGISLDLRLSYAPVSINIGLPVGLLVNELLLNSFKYAFEDRETGTISLECTREEDDRYRIVIADDGAGLPQGTVWPTPGKLGALVVETLRENAKIDLAVESAPGRGMRVRLAFTYHAPVSRVN